VPRNVCRKVNLDQQRWGCQRSTRIDGGYRARTTLGKPWYDARSV